MMQRFLQHLFGVSATVVFGNPIADWIGAGIVVAAVWILLSSLRKILASVDRRFAAAERPRAFNLIVHLGANTKQFLFIALALYCAEQFLTFPPRIERISSNLVVILLFLQIGIWAGRALQFYLEIKRIRSGDSAREFASSLDIIRFVSLLLIWSLVVLVALDNLGVNITALLAGLGVGGVAVALALQNVLGDIFASLSIALDKPFVVGDSLAIDSCVGTVERIGIKTTRLRSESGEQIILSNADILKSRVRNYGRTDEQRVLLVVSVAPDTAMEKLQSIPGLVKAVVESQPNSRFERCHLKTLADWALQFEIAFFTRDTSATPVPELRQAVNLGIVEAFRGGGIRFAAPALKFPVEQT